MHLEWERLDKEQEDRAQRPVASKVKIPLNQREWTKADWQRFIDNGQDVEGLGDIEYAQGKLNRLQGTQYGEEGPWHSDGDFTSSDSDGDYETAQSHVSTKIAPLHPQFILKTKSRQEIRKRGANFVIKCTAPHASQAPGFGRSTSRKYDILVY